MAFNSRNQTRVENRCAARLQIFGAWFIQRAPPVLSIMIIFLAMKMKKKEKKVIKNMLMEEVYD